MLVYHPSSVVTMLPERLLVRIRWGGQRHLRPMGDGPGFLRVREILLRLAALRLLARRREVGDLNRLPSVGVWRVCCGGRAKGLAVPF